MQCEYSACGLGVHRAGASGPALRALGGIIPVPLTDPESVVHHPQGYEAGGALPAGYRGGTAVGNGSWFHPLLGASSNHATGFHPGLEGGPGVAVGVSGGSSAQLAAGSGAGVGQDHHYCRNLRYTLDMLQRHLMTNPPSEPLYAAGPRASSVGDGANATWCGAGGGGAGDEASAAAAALVVVYVVAPTEQPGAIVRSLLEAACRLAPLGPRTSSPLGTAQAAACPEERRPAAEVSVPTTPPLDGNTASQQQQEQMSIQASELQHLRAQLEEVDRYLGAAADNFIPVLPQDSGSTGFGAAGATSAPHLVPLPRPPPLSDLGPLTSVDITLQPLDLAVLQDLSGGAARATALAVYSKLRRLPSALSHPLPSMLSQDAGSGHSLSSDPHGLLVVGRRADGDERPPAADRGRGPLASSSGCSPFLYEPPMVLQGTEAGSGTSIDGKPSAPQALHCSYSWHALTEHSDGTNASVPVKVWVAMAWTDSTGELLEAKAAALPPCATEAVRGAARAEARAAFEPGLAMRDALVAADVCRCVLTESRVMYSNVQAHGAAGGVFNRIVVTKAGPMASGEAFAWEQLLVTPPAAAAAAGQQGPSGSPRVLVASLDEIAGQALDLAMELPRGSYAIAAGSYASVEGQLPSELHLRPSCAPQPHQLLQLLLFPSSAPSVATSASGPQSSYRPMAGDGALWRLGFTLILDTGCQTPSPLESGNDHPPRLQKRQRILDPASPAACSPEEGPAASLRPSPAATALAGELYALSVLNATMFSVGRGRQVSLFGMGLDAPDGGGSGEGGRAFMPLHCYVADTLLSLCLASEEVLAGRADW